MISLAHAQAAAGAPPGGEYINLIMMVAMIAIFWLFLIRPQMKKHKEHQAMVGALAKGDEVVTGGGLCGRITKIGDNYLTLEIAEGTEVVVQKNLISLVLPKGTLKSL